MENRNKYTWLGVFFMEHCRAKTSFLNKVNELIDWQSINAILCKKIRRKAIAVSNPV